MEHTQARLRAAAVTLGDILPYERDVFMFLRSQETSMQPIQLLMAQIVEQDPGWEVDCFLSHVKETRDTHEARGLTRIGQRSRKQDRRG